MRILESESSTPEATSDGRVLKGAIVGIGGYGLVHLGSLKTLIAKGRVELCAAVHTGAKHEEETARELEGMGCELFLSVDDMFNKWGEALDFCTLPTSIASHVPLALRCIESGIHCLVEKPLTGDLAQLEELESTMEKHPSVLVTVGFQSLFLPEVMEIREKIAAGYIGNLKGVKLFGAWPRSPSYYNRNDWAGKVRTQDCTIYDSPLNNAMAHYLNLGLYWTTKPSGEPARVTSVEGSLYRAQEIENFDTASCRFHLESGLPVSTWVTHSSNRLIDISIVVEGEKGNLEWGREDALSWEIDGEKIPIKSTPFYEAKLLSLRSFIEAINGEHRPQCRNVPQAASHVRAIQMLQSQLHVEDVAPSSLSGVHRDGEKAIVINGVEELLLGGFKADTLVTLPTV